MYLNYTSSQIIIWLHTSIWERTYGSKFHVFASLFFFFLYKGLGIRDEKNTVHYSFGCIFCHGRRMSHSVWSWGLVLWLFFLCSLYCWKNKEKNARSIILKANARGSNESERETKQKLTQKSSSFAMCTYKGRNNCSWILLITLLHWQNGLECSKFLWF